MSEKQLTTARRGRPPRSQEQHEVERETIIKAARKLFKSEGYEGVSMRKIAHEAGCSTSSLYIFFQNKRQILHVFWEGVFLDLVRAVTNSYEATPQDRRIEAMSLTYINFWLNRPDDFRSIFLVEDKPEVITQDYFVDSSDAVPELDIFRIAILEAQTRGEIIPGDPDGLKNILLCAFHGLALNILTIPEYRWGDPDLLRDNVVRVIITGMSTTPVPGATKTQNMKRKKQ